MGGGRLQFPRSLLRSEQVLQFPRSLLLMVGCLWGCASAEPRTQVMLEIDAEQAVQEQTTRLRVEIRGGELGRGSESYAPRFTRTYPDDARLMWPRRIALVPLESEPERGYSVELSLESASGPLLTDRVLGSYAAGRTVLLRVNAQEQCVGVECSAEDRCLGGECVEARIDPHALPDLTE